MSLETYVDVWMPFDLAGRAQAALPERDAPRLSAVLRDLSAALLVNVDPEGVTPFARSVDSGLENRRDVDGVVITTTS